MKTYIKVTLADGTSYLDGLENLDLLIQDIVNAAADGSFDQTWKVEFIRMTEEEFDSFPDFDGP